MGVKGRKVGAQGGGWRGQIKREIKKRKANSNCMRGVVVPQIGKGIKFGTVLWHLYCFCEKAIWVVMPIVQQMASYSIKLYWCIA